MLENHNDLILKDYGINHCYYHSQPDSRSHKIGYTHHNFHGQGNITISVWNSDIPFSRKISSISQINSLHQGQ